MLYNSEILQNFEQKINPKKFHEILLEFLNWAKDCKSCSPRKMLQNAYLGANIGVDAEENEPSNVW